jgi:FKBP-type peptidyl-prolyl cis-trans isomerase SlyD
MSMQISKNKVTIIEYTLKNSEGEILDTSEGQEPMAYIHGIGNLLPALEAVLEGKGVGDEVVVSIPPEEGYGIPDAELVQVVERNVFPEEDDLHIGMQFQAQDDDGTHVIWVTDIAGDEVTIDGNHPLAGETLNFDVKVVGVRDAGAEELDHGHVHGPEGHHH